MVLVSLKQRLDHAAAHRYGVPAFNVMPRKACFEAFGRAGHAARIKPVPLKKLARRDAEAA